MDTFHAAVSTLHSFIKLIRSYRMKIFYEKDGIKTLQNLQEKILSWSRFERVVEAWSIAGVFPFNFVKFARASLLQNRKLMTLLFNNTVFFSVLPDCHRSPAVFDIWLFCSLDWVCLSWLVVLTKLKKWNHKAKSLWWEISVWQWQTCNVSVIVNIFTAYTTRGFYYYSHVPNCRELK